MKTFNTSSASITVIFPCPSCGEKIEKVLGLPVPNIMTDSVDNSTNSEEHEISCPNPDCEQEIIVNIYKNFNNEVSVEIDDVDDDDIEIEENEDNEEDGEDEF